MSTEKDNRIVQKNFVYVDEPADIHQPFISLEELEEVAVNIDEEGMEQVRFLDVGEHMDLSGSYGVVFVIRKEDTLNIGMNDRVEFTEDVYAYPDAKIEEGERGSVAMINDHGDPLLLVNLDEAHDGLEHWDNMLQIRENRYPTPDVLRKVDENDFKRLQIERAIWRPPTKKELDKVFEHMKERYGGEPDKVARDAVVLENYVSDSPGYCGRLLFVVFGHPIAFHLFSFDKDGEINIVNNEWE